MSNKLEFQKKLRQKASALKKRIVLPEGEDDRILEAAEYISKNNIASLILLGDETHIKKKRPNINFNNVKIFNPKTEDLSSYVDLLFELRKHKGVERAQAKALTEDHMYLSCLMVEKGEADGMVGGALTSTANTLRPSLQIIKTAPNISIVSSCFIMLFDKDTLGDNGILVFGDCAINPDPTSEQLASIALSTAETTQKLTGLTPRVALLSFSSKGSAKHPNAEKVIEAVKILKEKNPNFVFDGELQTDAAIVPKVAALKAPNSPLKGTANVLIFPDLQSGNIGYKLVQRLAGASAIGPICQGFKKPVNDLSRGCNSEEVIDVVAITALQAK